jgi:nitrite reductase/ring-hydroxylating ferredoxin subunit
MMNSSTPDNPTRRDIIRASLGGCAACLLAGCGGGRDGGSSVVALPDFMPGPVDAGPAASFPRDGIFSDHVNRGFFLVRRGDKLFAVSSVCTHQDVLLHASGGDIGCPRHGSVFSAEGVVQKAPAKQSLPHHAIRIDDRGHIIVDTSIDFDQNRWGSAEAVVTTKEPRT